MNAVNQYKDDTENDENSEHFQFLGFSCNFCQIFDRLRALEWLKRSRQKMRLREGFCEKE